MVQSAGQTDRDRDRRTDTDRQTQTDRQTDASCVGFSRLTFGSWCRQRDRETDRRTGRDRQTESDTDRKTDRLTVQTDRSELAV